MGEHRSRSDAEKRTLRLDFCIGGESLAQAVQACKRQSTIGLWLNHTARKGTEQESFRLWSLGMFRYALFASSADYWAFMSSDPFFLLKRFVSTAFYTSSAAKI